MSIDDFERQGRRDAGKLLFGFFFRHGRLCSDMERPTHDDLVQDARAHAGRYMRDWGVSQADLVVTLAETPSYGGKWPKSLFTEALADRTDSSEG